MKKKQNECQKFVSPLFFQIFNICTAFLFHLEKLFSRRDTGEYYFKTDTHLTHITHIIMRLFEYHYQHQEFQQRGCDKQQNINVHIDVHTQGFVWMGTRVCVCSLETTCTWKTYKHEVQ